MPKKPINFRISDNLFDRIESLEKNDDYSSRTDLFEDLLWEGYKSKTVNRGPEVGRKRKNKLSNVITVW